MRKAIEFRFTLSNPYEGSVEIDEPVGWNGSKFTLKRDQKYNSILFEYSSQLKFYRAKGNRDGGAEFILYIENKYGVDGEVNLLVEVSSHNGPWEVVFEGRLNLEDLIETEKYVETIAEQGDFFTIFNQRSDLQVSFKDNFSVDGVSLQPYEPYTLNMHSKVLVKRTEADIKQIITIPAQPTHEFTIDGRLPGPIPASEFASRTSYLQFDFSAVTSEELGDYWSVGGGASTDIPPEIYTVKEAGEHTFDIHLLFDVLAAAIHTSTFTAHTTCGIGVGMFERVKVDVHFEIRGEDDTQKYIESVAWSNETMCDVNSYTEEGVNVDFSLIDYFLEVGDKVFLYVSVEMDGEYERLEGFDSDIQYMVGYIMDVGSHLKIKGKTFTENSTAPAMRIHDVLQNLCNKLTNRDDSFHSDFFGYPGAPYHNYLTKGCGADFVIQCGFNIRNFPWVDRPLQLAFNTIFESLDAIFGLSLNLEVIDGLPKIRIEQLGYAYTKEVILNLDYVSGIKRTIAKDKFFSQVRVGYEEWKPEDINGLDEFATVHNYSTDLRTTGSTLTLVSKVIASGSLIEVTRRNQYNETLTTDTKYDDSLFIVALNHDNPAIAEKNENFDNVNNLLSPETAYNLRLWPTFNLLRNGGRINGGLLKKLGTHYKFQSGEGNYIVEMEMKESEVGCPGSYDGELLVGGTNIPWVYADLPEVEPIWVPDIFEFTYPLSFDDLITLKANKNKSLRITGDLFEDYVDAFVLDVESEPVTGLCNFKMVAASTLPFNYVPEDADNLLLQDGNNLLLEDGSLMLI